VVAAAADATGRDADGLRAAIDARIARDVAWAATLRPMLLELRGVPTEGRAAAYAKVLSEIEKP
jgi:hypothetical protein